MAGFLTSIMKKNLSNYQNAYKYILIENESLFQVNKILQNKFPGDLSCYSMKLFDNYEIPLWIDQDSKKYVWYKSFLYFHGLLYNCAVH